MSLGSSSCPGRPAGGAEVHSAVFVPLQILVLLKQGGGSWLVSRHIGKCQATFLNSLSVALQAIIALNPATLLLGSG